MIPTLNEHEQRVLGTLLEKAVITPEAYPLTLNALMLACNQKTSREPVTNLSSVDVQRAARDLEAKLLLKREENFKSGVEKYQQRFCNTAFSGVQLSAQAYAVLCLLLLRGAQTPGELRTRAGRLCSFEDNEAVQAVLQQLMEREGGPLVARLPRRSGRLDHEYMHLLGGVLESVALDTGREHADAGSVSRDDRVAQLEARVASLESALAELQRQLGVS